MTVFVPASGYAQSHAASRDGQGRTAARCRAGGAASQSAWESSAWNQTTREIDRRGARVASSSRWTSRFGCEVINGALAPVHNRQSYFYTTRDFGRRQDVRGRLAVPSKGAVN